MMLFSRFGKHGNLGNQLFQYAAMRGLSERYQCDFTVPEWAYSRYFKHKPKDMFANRYPPEKEVVEKSYHYNLEQFDEHREDFRTKNTDLRGWLQSEKYWEHCIDQVRKDFEFDDDFKNDIRFAYNWLFEKPTIAISIRQGDYVGNPNYELLPITFYLGALFEHFPDFENYNIVIFSDDPGYCKVHFESMPNVYYTQDLNAIQQLCLGSMCNHFIIANSTFSWWMAYLGEVNENTKVIRPCYVFSGKLAAECTDKDLWPGRWFAYDHKTHEGVPYKIDLRDVTFTIPVAFDHPDRVENLMLNLKILKQYFNTNIIVGEQGGNMFNWTQEFATYMKFDMPEFHRTKMLNDMAKAAKTPIIVNWDADVFCSPLALMQATSFVRQGIDMVYPYDGRFARVPRLEWKDELGERLDPGIFGKGLFKNTPAFQGTRAGDAPSVGGAIFFDRDSFIQGGMENENFINYGPEDVERYERFKRLGYSIKRVRGSIYHLDHFIGKKNGSANEHFNNNHALLERMQSMTNDELKRYVSSFPWVNKYESDYYDAINEDSKRSATSVFEAVEDYGMDLKNCNVLDIGCGTGAWGMISINHGIFYFGIDHKVPAHKLLITPYQYCDVDITRPINLPDHFPKMFDMTMCLEVLEHIPEASALQVVDWMCQNTINCILFSAAIPYQSGVGHINEKWQTWWIEQFAKHKFRPIAEFSEHIRTIKDVSVWYRQNLMLFGKNVTGGRLHDYVDPEMYLNIIKTLKNQR